MLLKIVLEGVMRKVTDGKLDYQQLSKLKSEAAVGPAINLKKKFMQIAANRTKKFIFEDQEW